jgi:hypothetical protein
MKKDLMMRVTPVPMKMTLLLFMMRTPSSNDEDDPNSNDKDSNSKVWWRLKPGGGQWNTLWWSVLNIYTFYTFLQWKAKNKFFIKTAVTLNYLSAYYLIVIWIYFPWFNMPPKKKTNATDEQTNASTSDATLPPLSAF